MQLTDTTSEHPPAKDAHITPDKTNELPFFPAGALAFLTLLVMLCAAIWFSIYFIMLNRI